MKILEVNKFYFPKRGAESHFLDVIELLKSAGHEVGVFSMEHSRNLPSQWQKYFVSTVGYTDEFSLKEKIKGIFRMFYSLEAKRKINGILDEFKPDIVHVHNIYHQLSPAILFEVKKRKIPVVMTVHDYKIVCPNHGMFLKGRVYDRCKDGKFYQCFLDRCVKDSYLKSFLAMLEAYWHKYLGTYKKNVDLFIVPSQFVKNILVDRGVPAAKISVLPHFISNGYSKNEENEQVSNTKKAIYFGAISKSKDICELVEIFSHLDGTRLSLAGNIEDTIDFSNLKNVNYLGFLSKDALSKAVGKTDCVVSCSRLPETFGLIALESISRGKPFFGIETGALGEIIKNGKNGILAEDLGSLKNNLEDYFNGKIAFDNALIAKDAEMIFGKSAYLDKFESMLSQLLPS